MMLALGNSEKCSRCTQTNPRAVHGRFTLESFLKAVDAFEVTNAESDRKSLTPVWIYCACVYVREVRSPTFSSPEPVVSWSRGLETRGFPLVRYKLSRVALGTRIGNLRTLSTTTGSELQCTAEARPVNFVVVVSSTTPNKVESRRPAIHKVRQVQIHCFRRFLKSFAFSYPRISRNRSFFLLTSDVDWKFD